MKIRSQVFGLLATGCALGIGLSQGLAAVSDEDFKALKDLVIKQGQQIDQLLQTHQQDQQRHAQDIKAREDDQQKLQQLQQQLGETQKTAVSAQQKADDASKIQPVHPIPSGTMSALQNFTMVGDAEVQFGKVGGEHSAFAMADFAPIFLFRARDNILFEAGFDVTLSNNRTLASAINGGTAGSGASTHVDLSFAQLDYMMNDYVTFIGGFMVLPLGTYSERAAGWLNKIPDDPLGREVLPGSGVGIQLRGAIPIGQTGQSITYSAFGVNGPSSIDGSATAANLDLGGNVGIDSNGDSGNLHGSPSGGARLGWFIPWKPHYDLELGISGQSGVWDDAGHRHWSAAVLDAALHISPYVELKGEYIHSWVGTDDLGTIKPQGWWLQGGYKLAGLHLEMPVVNNIELVGRYDTSRTGLGDRTHRYTVGYVYYFTNTLLFEGDHEFLHSTDPSVPSQQWLFQLSYGF